MIDFHSHVLPGIDDGAQSVHDSLRMLSDSYAQGVDVLFATSHFYADSEDPVSFLSRRAASVARLNEALSTFRQPVPSVLLGAEVLYFPGMSCADELGALTLGNTHCLLIEPPMVRWTEAMLDEIELTGKNLNVVPVIAHIDRYMRILGDDSLFERVEPRRLLVQVNTSFFLRPDSASMALGLLMEGRIHFIGSDCHNCTSRPQNMGDVVRRLRQTNAYDALERLDLRARKLLNR